MRTLRHAHVIYDYSGRSLTLMYPPDAIGIWEVYDGAHFLGLLVESYVDQRERYTPRRPRNDDSGYRFVTTDDWRSALMYLVEAA